MKIFTFNRSILSAIFLMGILCNALTIQAQTAPAHLKYFGFVAIDCFYDDPLDGSNTTNYVSEVDSFSNLAHMCVYDATDDIVARTQTMNAHCVNPMLHVQSIFFAHVDANAPSGYNYDLLPDYVARWNTFKTTNAAVLTASNIGCFYIADEPVWNGIPTSEMDLVNALLKNDFPDIPLLMVEAYTTVNDMEVPIEIDWVGFDRYGTYDPATDPDFTANLDTLKARLTSPTQKIVLIIDDQWYPEYQTFLGWAQDTMATIVQNYYNLAVADTSVIGLIGYIWPGGLDGPTQHGVRNLTPAVIQKNIAIGKAIKANFDPCNPVNAAHPQDQHATLDLFPNPASHDLYVQLPFAPKNGTLELVNPLGQCVLQMRHLHDRDVRVDVSGLENGVYLLRFWNDVYVVQRRVVVCGD